MTIATPAPHGATLFRTRFNFEDRLHAGRNMTATDTAMDLARVAAQAAADKLA